MDLFDVKTLLFLLSFIGCCTGQSILPAGPVDATLGTNVTFQTLVNKPDYFLILWNFNSGGEQVNVVTLTGAGVLKVNPMYTGRVAINNTNGFLYLGPVKAGDSGHYSISITSSDASTLTADTQLRVLEPVCDVTITSNMPEAIEYNSTVVLNCSAKGSFLKFAWLMGDKPIVDGNRFTLKQMGLSSTVTIANVLRTDLVGPIYCRAANQLQSQTSAPFNLTVYYGPEVPVVIVSPPILDKVIGSQINMSMSCSAISNPPATFTWYRNQQIMENAGPLLTLEVIKKHRFGSEEGEYTCKASNAKTGRVVSSAGVTFAVMDAISGAKVSGPNAALIAGNSTANLSCQATSGTVKTITWHKDGQRLSAGGRLVFSADMSSMMINPLQREDKGEYRCQLANPIHSVEASYRMVVNYGPEKAEVTGKKAVEVNNKVVLTCSADSIPPANLTWKFNGTDTGVKTAQFTIEMPTAKDTGKYTCEATNAVTGKNAMYTHSLTVQDKGTLPEGLSDGAIAGIIIGILIALAVGIGLIVYCRQKVPVESPY
ncbi:carcinoembryonic antigen-related cell adhesion molecule 5 isoform X2 [Sander lucioperca]|uniref:carcinoembryonic antigen-related cell adhesion molecule 5 isoform X2 n=1 Tax=Sander lucioperca TaxID=283035 RepID=UPI00125E7335|nr:carcinoembryonic antigen-related cell adhesion molecule 5 isoform X2 [Sander lucioperca]